jgi:uncharacterized protein
MPHQCTKCGIVFPDASEEILTGCSCGSRFFYYIKQEKMDSLEKEKEMQEKIQQLDKADKIQIEQDIREITGMEDEPEKPVILDLESVKVLEPGKFEIDIINLFSKKRPLIYKLEEGKYIIDLSDSFKASPSEINKKIRDPSVVLGSGDGSDGRGDGDVDEWDEDEEVEDEKDDGESSEDVEDERIVDNQDEDEEEDDIKNGDVESKLVKEESEKYIDLTEGDKGDEE